MRTIEIKKLAVSKLRASGLNPRHVGEIPPEELAALGAQLRAGQQEPLIVRDGREIGTYEIADGETRWAAARAADSGISHLECEVREMSDGELVLMALAKGSDGARRNLSDVEAAEGYRRLMELEKIPQAELARRLGVSQGSVAKRLQLLELPVAVQRALIRGELSAQVGRLLARVRPEVRASAVKAVLNPPGGGGALGYEEARVLIEANFCRSMSEATWKLSDPVGTVVACEECPHFEAGVKKRAAVCHEPECFEAKLAAVRARAVAAAEAAGKVVLSARESAEALAVVEATGRVVASWDSGYALAGEPPPEDLLKPELRNAAGAKVEAFGELAAGSAATAKIYTAFDARGRAVDLVKVEEAVVAAELNGHAIFTREVVSRASAAGSDVAAGAESGEPTVAQRAKAEKDEARAKVEAGERKARERRAAGEEAVAKWIGAVWKKLPAKLGAEDEVTANLWLEEEIERAEKGDVAFMAKALGRDAAGLADWIAEMKGREMLALACLVRLTPWVRSAGADAPIVVEWHRAVLEGGR